MILGEGAGLNIQFSRFKVNPWHWDLVFGTDDKQELSTVSSKHPVHKWFHWTQGRVGEARRDFAEAPTQMPA